MKKMTLEEYLRKNLETNAIDHILRCHEENGRLRFYIHPYDRDGDTPDFFVDGNALETIYFDPPNDQH